MKNCMVDLLNNRKRYTAQVNMMKSHPQMCQDPDEFERLMQLERDLVRLDFCIEQLTPKSREAIEYLYVRGYSMGNYAKARCTSKGAIQNRKRVALRELKAIFD